MIVAILSLEEIKNVIWNFNPLRARSPDEFPGPSIRETRIRFKIRPFILFKSVFKIEK